MPKYQSFLAILKELYQRAFSCSHYLVQTSLFRNEPKFQMIATQAVTSFLLSSFGHFLAPKNGRRQPSTLDQTFTASESVQ